MNSEDLEEILGPRPFQSSELRNIDKFKQGFQKPQAAQVDGIETENPKQPPTPTPEGAIPGTLEGPAPPQSTTGETLGGAPDPSAALRAS